MVFTSLRHFFTNFRPEINKFSKNKRLFSEKRPEDGKKATRLILLYGYLLKQNKGVFQAFLFIKTEAFPSME